MKDNPMNAINITAGEPNKNPATKPDEQQPGQQNQQQPNQPQQGDRTDKDKAQQQK